MSEARRHEGVHGPARLGNSPAASASRSGQWLLCGRTCSRSLADGVRDLFALGAWWAWGHSTDVVPQADEEGRDGEQPEDEAERLGHAALEVRGPVGEVEREGHGDGEDGHVDGETERGQESCGRVVVSPGHHTARSGDPWLPLLLSLAQWSRASLVSLSNSSGPSSGQP